MLNVAAFARRLIEGWAKGIGVKSVGSSVRHPIS